MKEEQGSGYWDAKNGLIHLPWFMICPFDHLSLHRLTWVFPYAKKANEEMLGKTQNWPHTSTVNNLSANTVELQLMDKVEKRVGRKVASSNMQFHLTLSHLIPISQLYSSYHTHTLMYIHIHYEQKVNLNHHSLKKRKKEKKSHFYTDSVFFFFLKLLPKHVTHTHNQKCSKWQQYDTG